MIPILSYTIDVPEEEMAAAMNIQATWKQLIIYSKTKDLRLIHIKLKFRDVTSKEDQEFRERLIVIRNEFLGQYLWAYDYVFYHTVPYTLTFV